MSDGDEPSIFPRFERKSEPLLPRRSFIRRLSRCVGLAAALVALSLAVGMTGYRGLERLSWMDAFLNSAMLIGGMGAISPLTTTVGKLFAGVYAVYCGLLVVLVAGIVLAPVVHRFLHWFHLEDPRSSRP